MSIERQRLRTNYIILLVEDQADDIFLTQKAFSVVQERTGVVVNLTVMRNGLEAFNYLSDPSNLKPDLILVDIAMPVMTGLELLKKLKDPDSDLRTIPVCMLTTSRHDHDVWLSYANYCSGYLQKPVSPDDFVKQLTEVSLFFFDVITLAPRR